MTDLICIIALKGTNNKWLNIQKLVQSLLPKNRILKIKYFTAHVIPRRNDPDQPNRQQIFLRALRTIPNLEIILGHFLSHIVTMPLANCPAGNQQFVKVIKTEEKGSDFVKPIRQGVLSACQFPTQLKDDKGPFSKPPTW